MSATDDKSRFDKRPIMTIRLTRWGDFSVWVYRGTELTKAYFTSTAELQNYIDAVYGDKGAK